MRSLGGTRSQIHSLCVRAVAATVGLPRLRGRWEPPGCSLRDPPQTLWPAPAHQRDQGIVSGICSHRGFRPRLPGNNRTPRAAIPLPPPLKYWAPGQGLEHEEDALVQNQLPALLEWDLTRMFCAFTQEKESKINKTESKNKNRKTELPGTQRIQISLSSHCIFGRWLYEDRKLT